MKFKKQHFDKAETLWIKELWTKEQKMNFMAKTTKSTSAEKYVKLQKKHLASR